MAEQTYVVFLTNIIPLAERQALADAVAPKLRVAPDKVMMLLSRPVGPLTRASSYKDSARIRDIMQEAGVPVELRDSQGNPVPEEAPRAPAPQPPSAPSPASASRPASPTLGGFQPSQLHNDPSRTVFDDRVNTLPTSSLPEAKQVFSDDDFGSEDFGVSEDFGANDGFDDFDDAARDVEIASEPPARREQATMPGAMSSSMSSSMSSEAFADFAKQQRSDGEGARAHPTRPTDALDSDDFGDIAFDDDDDDFNDMDVPLTSSEMRNDPNSFGDWDNTLDEDEHERLLATRQARQAGILPREDASTKEADSSQKARFPIAYKLLLTVLLPLLAFALATYFIVNSQVTNLAENLLLQVGDNIATGLAADVSDFVEREGVTLADDATVLFFNGKMQTIAPSLNRSAGVHFTDGQGDRYGGFWESSVAGTDFDIFNAQFRELAAQSLQVADFEDDEAARARSLQQRTLQIQTAQGDFFVVAAPLAGDEGTVQVVIAEREVLETARRVINPILYSALITLAIAIAIAALVAFTISRNLRRLAGTAERIALGDLEEPVIVQGNDEIRDLSEAFESMRQSLQAAIERLGRRKRR